MANRRLSLLLGAILACIALLPRGVSSKSAGIRCTEAATRCNVNYLKSPLWLAFYGYFRRIVSNGRVELDCSDNNRELLRECMDSAKETCRDNVLAVRSLTAVHDGYTYVCNNQQAFIAADSCMNDFRYRTALGQCGREVRSSSLTARYCQDIPDCVGRKLAERREYDCAQMDGQTLAGFVKIMMKRTIRLC